MEVSRALSRISGQATVFDKKGWRQHDPLSWGCDPTCLWKGYPSDLPGAAGDLANYVLNHLNEVAGPDDGGPRVPYTKISQRQWSNIERYVRNTGPSRGLSSAQIQEVLQEIIGFLD